MVRVLTYGTFDLLHYGHIEILRRAKALGDYLVVAISTDEFNKGKGKTSFYDYETRKRMLEAIRYVDLVIPEESWEQKLNDVREYKIDKVVMGSDWEGSDRFDYLKEYCEVIYLPRTPRISSSHIKDLLKSQSTFEGEKDAELFEIGIRYPGKDAPGKISSMIEKYQKLPLEWNKVLCINNFGKGYGSNVKYIVEELRKMDPELDIVWAIDSNYKMPKGIRTVPYGSDDFFREMATARVIVDNKLKPLGFKKRKKQFLVTAPQGNLRLLKTGLDNADFAKNADYAELIKKNAKLSDIIAVNSSAAEKFFTGAYGSKSYCMKVGTPQCDSYFAERDSLRIKAREMLKIPADVNLCVWAPFYRSGDYSAKNAPDFEKLLSSLKGKWAILVNQHPHAKKAVLPANKNIIDITQFDDSQCFIAASDMLITDYSSLMFEYLQSGNPCFLFAPDLDEFCAKNEFYYSLDELPFPVSRSTEELISSIRFFKPGEYSKKAKSFIEKNRVSEKGNASAKLAMTVSRMTREKNYHINDLKFIEFRKYAKQVRDKESISPRKIVFSQFGGDGYGCNPKAICDEIIRRGHNWQLEWILKKEVFEANRGGLPEQVKPVVAENGGRNIIHEMETAKVWVNNIHFAGWLDKGVEKRDGQIYINTFHGGISLKRAGEDRDNFNIDRSTMSRKALMHLKDCEMVDFAISSSDLGDRIVDRFFMGKAEILRLGDARSDILINGDDDVVKKVHEHFGIPLSTKIVMYAPTFRDDADLSCFTLDYEKMISSLKKKFGGEWAALAKMHPRLVSKAEKLIPALPYVTDASTYNDMQELMLASDVLISDYSSVLTDFMLSRKPGFMYCVDLDKYMATRGLYFGLDELPFPIIRRNDDIEGVIEGFDESVYTSKIEALLDGINYIGDGKAAARVVDLIEQYVK